MGNFDRFEKLDMLGELNEKYIKEADKYLAEPLLADTDVIQLAPVKSKLSWKPFAAAAAVLVIGAAVLAGVKLRQNRVEPSDIITPEQQAYLDEVKGRLGTTLDVSYAVDSLNFTEIDLPDDMYPDGFIDENRALVIKEDPETLEKTLEIYNIREKTYTVIAQLGSDGRRWRVNYADKDHVIYLGGYSETRDRDDLYLYDVNTGSTELIYSDDNADIDIEYNYNPVTANGKVYFSIRTETGYSLHIYDTESKTELAPIDNARGPMLYKNDILYIVDGKHIRSLSGQYEFEVISDFIYDTKNGLYNIDAWDKVTEIVSQRELLPYHYTTDPLVELSTADIEFACDFAVMLTLDKYSDDAKVFFIYNESADEMAIFCSGDGFYSFNDLGWGICALKAEADGTRREFIITGERSENSAEIARPVPGEYIDDNIVKIIPTEPIPDGAEFLKDGRFVSFLPVVSADDAIELVPIDTGAAEDDYIFYNPPRGNYDLDGDGFHYIYPYPTPDPDQTTISGNRIMRGKYFDIDHTIVRLTALFDAEYPVRPTEWGYYDPTTRAYTTLFKCAENENWLENGIEDNYLIFFEENSCNYLLIERSSIGTGGEPNIIRIGEELRPIWGQYVLGDNGIFYFNAFDGDGKNAMYSYELATGKLSKMIANAYPVFYSGDLFYVGNCSVNAETGSVDPGFDPIIRQLNSKRAFKSDYQQLLSTNDCIYKIKYLYRDGESYAILYNALTGENIFGAYSYVGGNDFGSDLFIKITGVFSIDSESGSAVMNVLYDKANERLITYSGETEYSYLGKIDGRDVVYSYSEGDTMTMYWITLK